MSARFIVCVNASARDRSFRGALRRFFALALIRRALPALAALLVFALALSLFIGPGSPKKDVSAKAAAAEASVGSAVFGLSPPRKSQMVIEPRLLDAEALFLLVDSVHPLPDSFAPEVYSAAKSLGGSVQLFSTSISLERRTLSALTKLCQFARGGGFTTMCLYAGEHTRAVQSGMLYRAESTAGGGCSSHQTGFALDLCAWELGSLRPGLYMSDAEREIVRCGAKSAGFIEEKCPEGDSRVHLRFVGEEMAALVWESGLSYEKTLTRLHETGQASLYENGLLSFTVYAVSESELEKNGYLFPVPKGVKRAVYGKDNTGYVIVVCRY
ncbi:MAG: hypothetical protein PHI27_01830 [Eubacteriales bacterium]|nr:hypothetical protein [Eubacteriales bacterium]MDD4511960.1 hypothetical protein [Eubacteriales bacterium]